MKEKISYLLFVFILLFISQVKAVYIENYPTTLKQPNGQVIHCFISGDEYYNWVHDLNNFTIVQDYKTGYYVYALKVNGEFVPSKFIVGSVDPAKAGLTSGMNISPDKMLEMRNEVLKNIPENPAIQKMKRAGLSPAPNVGNLNNIVIFIRFKGEVEFTDPTNMYDVMFNGGKGVNSLKNYFEEVSYNTLHISTTFYPLPSGGIVVSYQDTVHTRGYFQPFDTTTNPIGYKSGQNGMREQTLLAEAVDAVDSLIPTSLDIDYNNDGNVDNICFIISGATTAWNTLLWPHRWSMYLTTAYINGKRVWDYNLQLRNYLNPNKAGVLCHEMFHTLGAPDLYHYNSTPVNAVGGWDVMCNTGDPAQSMGAFMKYKYGKWIASIPEITGCGRYTLNPVTSPNNNCYKIASPNSSTEYFILEYRNKTGLFESQIPGSGLIIYRINTTAGSGNASGPPDEVYIYRPHGTTTINGVIDSAFFGLNYNKTRFNFTTDPQCYLYNNSDGGIDISNISLIGGTISFNVNFKNVKPAAEFVASSFYTCTGKKVSLTDYSSCAASSWLWTITPGTFSFINSTSASSQNPEVVFNSDGVYNISLQVSNTNGNNTKSKTITVGSGSPLPFTEDFESRLFSTNSWDIVNPDTAFTWTLTQKPKFAGYSTSTAFMNFFNYTPINRKDDLIAKNIKLNNLSFAQLKFKVSYRRINSNSKDSLNIFISTNCGVSFDSIPVYQKSGNTLATGGNTTSEFFPSGTSDWRTDSVNLSTYIGKNIIIKFQAINNHGNNLFLDDINVTGYLLPVAGFTTSDTQVCEHSTITYTDSSTGDITSRLWTFPGGNPSFSTVILPTVTYDTPGVYHVSLKVNYNLYSNEKKYYNHIYIDSIPSKPFITWDYTNYLLHSSFTKGNKWYDGNGLITSATGKTYKPIVSGFYYLFIDNNGCISESSDTITINTNIPANGIEKRALIYPNPNQGKFSVTFNDPGEEMINARIINSLGKTVFEKIIINSNQKDHFFDTEFLSPGIYFINIKTNRNIYSVKFAINQ